MEQRVRDIIESLQKFDPDTRVSEKTTLSFKYDGMKTRLVVECNGAASNGVDLSDENQSLLKTVIRLENEVERLEGEIDKQIEIIDELESEMDAIKRVSAIKIFDNAVKSLQSK